MCLCFSSPSRCWCSSPPGTMRVRNNPFASGGGTAGQGPASAGRPAAPLPSTGQDDFFDNWDAQGQGASQPAQASQASNRVVPPHMRVAPPSAQNGPMPSQPQPMQPQAMQPQAMQPPMQPQQPMQPHQAMQQPAGQVPNSQAFASAGAAVSGPKHGC
eukprot:Skav228739  [mRNA]  locus=scaffold655:267516:274735:- [translate_table: standard]